MKFVLLIAVFCVVPCAFQDIWDDYDTWYDELNDDVLPRNIDLPKDDQAIEPESVENDENKEFHAADYGFDDNYRDYEIEDNRDEVKNKLEKEQEQNQDLDPDDYNFDSAVQDFDAFQQINNKDKLSEDVIDTILEVDKKSQMNLNDVKNKLEIDKEQNQGLDPDDYDFDSAVQDVDALQQDINNDKLNKDAIDKISEVDEKSQMDLNDMLSDDFPENEVKNKLEEEQEQNQGLDPDDYDFDSAVQDVDAFQQNINNDKLSEDAIAKISEVDEKSQMDLNNLLSDDFSESDNENVDAIPAMIALDKEVVEDFAEDKNESKDNVEKGDKDVQSDIGNIREETQQLLEKFDSVFDEDDDADTKDVPKIEAQSNLQDIVNQDSQILEDTNANFDENKVMKEEKQNADLLVAEIEDEIKETVDETRQILEKTNNDFDENKDAKDEQPIAEIEADMKDIIDETRQILEETNSNLDETVNEKDNQQNLKESVQDVPVLEVEENADDEDSVDKVYEDLNEDLDKLFDTWRKLSLENSDEADVSAINDDDVKVEVNADDDLNRNYDNIGEDVKGKIDFDYEGEARILDTRNDYYESLMDKSLSKLFEEFLDEEDGEDRIVSLESIENNADEVVEKTGPILYGNDALAADSSENNTEEHAEKNEPIIQNPSSEKSEDEPETDKIIMSSKEDKVTKATKDVEDLTSSELDQLSQQFVLLHDSELNTMSDDTPIHITLTSDEPVVITSPNYPNSYPTDQTVVDWILEGLGTGIEVNITDLAINSAQGHFLMIKPGQSDASGGSGIVFAYRINSERRYRFRDVNKMFVRFNPLGGMSFSRGFQLSARMIEPPAGESEDIPEPEFLIPEPEHTATLLLAGVNTTEFLELKDEFQRLLADMATMYINANSIDPGMNSTAVVTQITRSYVCNINWPGFDSCVQVTFGVPLVYDDEDSPSRLTEDELMEMWDTYASRDPFAARLSQMGISDYTVPKEAKILTVWVVIGVGVVIAAAMLGIALWRYSCIDNYTRMQDYNDTDSIVDKKRGLDMYPTPHQTLPPLYTENDYKWADRTFDDSTRVDMGGFTNNTFTHDDVSSESEDDVVVPRDRNSFKPRDFSAV